MDWLGGGRTRCMYSNYYKTTLVNVSKNDSIIRLNVRYEWLIYVIQETRVYVILDIN